jgi:methionyl-tRNA formyltransferase
MVINNSIVFFGSGPVAAKSLEFLAKHFSIEAVITKAIPAHHKGTAPVEELVKNTDLPILFASNKTELDELFATHTFDSSLGIIIDYGVIVSKNIIDTFGHGILNSHFSLLPEWRGADPITFSILSGQKKTGVSLMIIEPTMDTGKLIAQKSLVIDPQDTTPILTDRLINLSNEMIAEYVPAYQAGEIKPRQQPHPDRATYSRKLTKEDGIIDWKKPAHQIECEVRAYRGWPGSRTTILSKSIIVTKSHVSSEQKTPLDILCGDGAYLSVDELIAPSGKTMNAQAFLNGYAAG